MAKRKAVRRVKPKKRSGPKSRTKHKMSRADKDNFSIPEGLSLPAKKKGIDKDIRHYTILIYGREKIGKSTIFSGFPRAIFFSTEPGTKGLDIFDFNHEDGGVKNWAIFRKGVELLINNPDQFANVVIDTVDRAYDMCLDWVCENRGIEYPGEDSSGSADFGKSWRAVKTEFTTQIHRLERAGIGVSFVSHAKEVEIRSRFGESYTRIFPTMANQARVVVEALVDFFFYAEYAKTPEGHQRVLICEGDETIWAGARSAGGIQFPKVLPMIYEDTYEIILQAFNGEYKGFDPASLTTTKATSKTLKDFVSKGKAKAANPKGGKKKAIRKRK